LSSKVRDIRVVESKKVDPPLLKTQRADSHSKTFEGWVGFFLYYSELPEKTPERRLLHRRPAQCAHFLPSQKHRIERNSSEYVSLLACRDLPLFFSSPSKFFELPDLIDL